MSHADERTLHAFIDGALGERERAQLETHLSACTQCRTQLEEAEALSRRASGLLSELEPDPFQPPSWREIEERAAARRATVKRRPWLQPSLAWAASIGVAFVLGWFSSSYWLEIPGGAAEFVARQPQPVVSADELQTRSELEERPALDRINDNFPPAAAGERFDEADEGAAARLRATAPATTRADEPADAGRQERRESQVAELDQNRQGARALSADKRAAEPPSEAARQEDTDRVAEAKVEPRQRETTAPLDPSALAARVSASIETERTLQNELPALRKSGLAGEQAGFISVEEESAALWLGGQLRTIPELHLQQVEVGPGAALGGLVTGLPVVRLVYEDAAGTEIVLIQQRLGVEMSDDSGPSLVVDPSGLRAYRWFDGEGYQLILVGSVSSDSLRALAERVR